MGAEYEKKSGVHIDVMPVTDDSPYTRIVSLYNSGNPPTMSILDTTDVIALAEGFVFSRAFVSIGDSTGWSLFEASWLSDPAKAFAALVMVSVWQLSGYMILIYVAGFMGLSEDVMEAASIDGASGWRRMINIVMPLMMSSITICLFLTLSRAFMVYDVNLSLTAGGPYSSTEMAAMHVYEKAFTSRQFGAGQAEALILFLVVACISGLQVYFTKKQEVEA